MIQQPMVLMALLMVSVVLAIDQSRWDDHSITAWVPTRSYLEVGHSLKRHPYLHQYDFKVPQGDEEDAWRYALEDHHGPVYKTHVVDATKSFYILTKIPNGHPLVSKWNLDRTGDNRISKSAFLFWKVKKDSHKLLGAEAWATGDVLQQEHTIKDLMLRYFDKRI